ncbi:MAG: alpha/beta hydrolase, partial [Desulfobacterales bacterium]|nr:alpha/beta hydrolase [Desulfobacterales bacterium]
RQKGHINNYSEYLEDLNYFVNNIVRPAAVSPLIMLAHSMGGHVALRFLHDSPESADKAVLTSPMIDINIPSFPRWLVRFIAFCASRAGFGHSYSVGSKGYSASNIKFEGNALTSDPVRFMDEHRAVAERPELALGGVTYGWLAATFKSIDILSDIEYARKIKTPVLIISAGKDRIVSETAQRAICSVMEEGSFVSIPDSFHEILKERDTVRKTFWKEFDQFAV